MPFSSRRITWGFSFPTFFPIASAIAPTISLSRSVPVGSYSPRLNNSGLYFARNAFKTFAIIPVSLSPFLSKNKGQISHAFILQWFVLKF